MTIKLTKNSHYDKGYGYINNYSFNDWTVVNIGSGWMVEYKGKDKRVQKECVVGTLKIARNLIGGYEDMISK